LAAEASGLGGLRMAGMRPWAEPMTRTLGLTIALMLYRALVVLPALGIPAYNYFPANARLSPTATSATQWQPRCVHAQPLRPANATASDRSPGAPGRLDMAKKKLDTKRSARRRSRRS